MSDEECEGQRGVKHWHRLAQFGQQEAGASVLEMICGPECVWKWDTLEASGWRH